MSGAGLVPGFGFEESPFNQTFYNRKLCREQYKTLNEFELKAGAEIMSQRATDCNPDQEDRKRAKEIVEDLLHELFSRPLERETQ